MLEDIKQFPVEINNEKITSILKKVLGDTDGLNEVVELLALPDKHFNALAPIILEELQKNINNPNEQMRYYNELITAQLTKEEIHAGLTETDTLFKTNTELQKLPQNKRDFIYSVVKIVYNGLLSSQSVGAKCVNIPIELCHPDAKIPTYANINDAGMDIYALDDIIIAPGETKLVPTGLKVAIPAGYELQIRPKSGRALKTKLRIANTPGTVKVA